MVSRGIATGIGISAALTALVGAITLTSSLSVGRKPQQQLEEELRETRTIEAMVVGADSGRVVFPRKNNPSITIDYTFLRAQAVKPVEDRGAYLDLILVGSHNLAEDISGMGPRTNAILEYEVNRELDLAFTPEMLFDRVFGKGNFPDVVMPDLPISCGIDGYVTEWERVY